jgi:hypothetical protein
MLVDKLQPGTRIRVTQAIQRRDTDWQTSVTGEVISCGPEKTGSWFAHHPKGKLVLTRLRLRKDDGELTTLTLDDRSQVEVLADGDGA